MSAGRKPWPASRVGSSSATSISSPLYVTGRARKSFHSRVARCSLPAFSSSASALASRLRAVVTGLELRMASSSARASRASCFFCPENVNSILGRLAPRAARSRRLPISPASGLRSGPLSADRDRSYRRSAATSADCSGVRLSGSMRTRMPPSTDSFVCTAAATMRLAARRRTPGSRLSPSAPLARTAPTVSMPASMSGANDDLPLDGSRSVSTGITSSASATSRSRTASYARRATSRASPGAARTASIASWTARPSATTARAAFPGRSGPASAGSPSAVTGSVAVFSSASCATVVRVSVFELAIGRLPR